MRFASLFLAGFSTPGPRIHPRNDLAQPLRAQQRDLAFQLAVLIDQLVAEAGDLGSAAALAAGGRNDDGLRKSLFLCC